VVRSEFSRVRERTLQNPGEPCRTLWNPRADVIFGRTSTFLQDVRYAFRTSRRSLVLTLVIVASLAIGIGANTAIFSVVNARLLKPLPYPEPERLVVLWLRSPRINIP
jgi:hypothetical protein